MKVRSPRNNRPRAFTLIELMISIAMVLILLVGVNQVFTYTTQAVGAGQALSANTRDSRATQTALNNDLGGAASDGAFFLIHSANVYAFRNRADSAADKDGDASTVDLVGSGEEGQASVPGDKVAPTTLNRRNHRVDVLSFFSRGNFPAQTGGSQLVYPNVASHEARVWYGFCKLPDNNYFNPGDASYSGLTHYFFPGLQWQKSVVTANYTVAKNPNNFFATDWVLGRVATLLLPSIPAVTDSFAQPTVFPPTDLSPLTGAAQHTDSSTNQMYVGSESRYDVATNTSLSGYYKYLYAWITNPANSANEWWTMQAGVAGGDFLLGPYGTVNDTLFECNPFTAATTVGDTLQMTPAKAARATPYLLRGCTQFCVEYAGDFFTQDSRQTVLVAGVVTSNPDYGYITGLSSTNTNNGDGIDYYLTKDAAGNETRHVRWYGFPRNSNGGLTVVSNAADPAQTVDVVPLRDIITAANSAYGLNMTSPAAFERNVPAVAADYSTNTAASMSDYLCAWGPDTDNAGVPRPKMIRITFTIDSGSPQLPDGQTFQYVYTLPN